MKKITDFIVQYRNFILFIFIIFSVIAIIASKNVNINYDIAKYLPDSSETRIGMDIMEDEFDETESSLNLMFKGLSEDEKDKIHNELENINGVSSVDYENSEDYNKDDYTLYVVNVDDAEDSEIAKEVYENIDEKYNDYETYTSGAISQRNNPVLPMWIIVLAVGCAFIILIIMSESYVEPILFLFTILMAVLLNKGTNIFLDNVSNITSSISAILQMALSMDYSIMLINRYRQERENEDDKVEAMKKALYNAFKSISSSSVTTIVGLIALVFMSFKIGRNLGLVLAKGVLFSLICIFFVLPALILMFDKLIAKTKKKSPHIKLDGLGKFSYKIRYISVPIFVLVFLFSFIEKGNLDILYTDSQSDKISEIFKEDNQIAIVYKNEDEENIAKKLSDIEDVDKVKEVLGYGNTINQELKYNELNDKLKDLGADVTIEDYLLQILYYNYYNQNENNRITFGDFVSFIKNDVYNNKEMSEHIDEDIKNNVDKLENFTNETLFSKPLTSSELSNILGIDKESIDDILVYYNSKNNNVQISLNEFINFMNNDVLTNNKYSSKIDNTQRANIKKLSNFTNSSIIQKKMRSDEIAVLFGIDKNIVDSLYKYYISLNEIQTKLTLHEFSDFVLNDVLKNPEYTNLFDNQTINSINLLNTFSNLNIITKNMNSSELFNLFKIDENSVKQLLFLKYSNIDYGKKMSISEFINNIVYIKNNTKYLEGTDISSLENLAFFAKNEKNINTTKMDKNSLSAIFDNVSPGLVSNIYLYMGLPDNYAISPQDFLNLIISNLSTTKDSKDEPALIIDEKNMNNLKLLKLIIDDSVSQNKIQYSESEMSKLLSMNLNQISQLYALTDMVQNNTGSWNITPFDFVKLIIENKDNENISSSIDASSLTQLQLSFNIMSSSMNNQSYSYNELAQFIGIDSSSSKNIYTLYTINNSSLELTPQEMVNFILSHKNDATLSGSLNQNMIKDLNLVQSVINGVINNKKYNSSELSNLLDINESDLKLLYGLYYTKYVNVNPTMSTKDFVNFLANDVIKNVEYANNFTDEAKSEVNTINGIINASLNKTKYSKEEIFAILSNLADDLDKDMVELVYIYYGSNNEYNNNWTLTVEKFINYLNDTILKDSRFDDFIEEDMRKDIIDAKEKISDSKKLLIGENYSRIVINTKFDPESEETFDFIKKLKDKFGDKVYIAGNSVMAYEMSKSFGGELNFITILTMILIFIVVAITFKSIIIPIILVLTIQCAVYMTMGILSFSGEGVYFIALLIVQSILMGATIDYAILYTSYYIEHRRTMKIKDAVINSYNKSIHTIGTSASILIIVTLIVGHFSSAITSQICKTISEGTICSTILILFLLPSVIAICDKIIYKKSKNM